MNRSWPLVLMVLVAGCGGGGTNTDPFIGLVDPAAAKVGEEVTIYGTNLVPTGGTADVKFGSLTATVTASSATVIRAIVPAGYKKGNVAVTVGSKTTLGNFGTADGIWPESEPNESAISASSMFGRRTGKGLLVSLAEKDYFEFNKLMLNKTYRVTLAPRIVGELLRPTGTLTLDAQGEALVTTDATGIQIFGVTGVMEAYTITLEPVP